MPPYKNSSAPLDPNSFSESLTLLTDMRATITSTKSLGSVLRTL